MSSAYKDATYSQGNMDVLVRFLEGRNKELDPSLDEEKKLLKQNNAMIKELVKCKQALQHNTVDENKETIFKKIIRYIIKHIDSNVENLLQKGTATTSPQGSKLSKLARLQKVASLEVPAQRPPDDVQQYDSVQGDKADEVKPFYGQNMSQTQLSQHTTALLEGQYLDPEIFQLGESQGPGYDEEQQLRMLMQNQQLLRDKQELQEQLEELQRHGAEGVATSDRAAQAQETVQSGVTSPDSRQIDRLVDQVNKLTQQNLALIKTQSDYQARISSQAEEIARLRAENEQLSSKYALIKAENDEYSRQVMTRHGGQEQIFNIQELINSKLNQITSIQQLQQKRMSQDELFNDMAVNAFQLKQQLVNLINQNPPTCFGDQFGRIFQEKIDFYNQMLGNMKISKNVVKSLQRKINIGELGQGTMPVPARSVAKPVDILETEVVKLLTRFGTKAPQLQRVDRSRWLVERTGQILTLQLNDRGTVMVVDDSGQMINRQPLTIYLKGIMCGQVYGKISHSKQDA